jgi:tripeptidyl-peptidase I
MTVIIADGDAGSVDLGVPPMSQRHCTPLHADWPSNSQYVTAIGSTYLTPYSLPICYTDGLDQCEGNPIGEVSVGVNHGMRWTTGGGFSQFIARPSWQEEAVQQYLNAGDAKLPPQSIFNANGRAYGDAVTCGHNLAVYMKNSGGWTDIDGTS